MSRENITVLQFNYKSWQFIGCLRNFIYTRLEESSLASNKKKMKLV